MSCSKSDLEQLVLRMILWISWDQERCLSAGSWMRRRRKSRNHPKMVLVSLGAPSADNLSQDKTFSRGMGSDGESGREITWIARGTAAGAREQLYGSSRKRVLTSSTKTSVIPSGCGGGSSIVGKAGARGMSEGRRSGGGTKSWSGDLKGGVAVQLGS